MYLNFLGEGGGEHESLPLAHVGHRVLLHNSPDLRLKAHVQHPVGLVQHQEAAVLQTDLSTVQQVDEAARSGHQQVAAPLQLPHLVK